MDNRFVRKGKSKFYHVVGKLPACFKRPGNRPKAVLVYDPVDHRYEIKAWATEDIHDVRKWAGVSIVWIRIKKWPTHNGYVAHITRDHAELLMGKPLKKHVPAVPKKEVPKKEKEIEKLVPMVDMMARDTYDVYNNTPARDFPLWQKIEKVRGFRPKVEIVGDYLVATVKSPNVKGGLISMGLSLFLNQESKSAITYCTGEHYVLKIKIDPKFHGICGSVHSNLMLHGNKNGRKRLRVIEHPGLSFSLWKTKSSKSRSYNPNGQWHFRSVEDYRGWKG